ncbi:MAG: GIY-YIG nuclease family protein [Desulfotomaculaceae bacterium]|nr:GIY-YIG nuclease family protein [Desulfotomaculaceae bacterium]
MPYTYILQCNDGSYYTGWTTNLAARLKVHNEGKGARYTRSRLPVRLVYWEAHPDRSTAMRREAIIRKLKRNDKIRLIRSLDKCNQFETGGSHDSGNNDPDQKTGRNA